MVHETASTLHVTRWGTSGPRVVLIHGSAQGSQVGGDAHFARQQDLAARGWQLLCPIDRATASAPIRDGQTMPRSMAR